MNKYLSCLTALVAVVFFSCAGAECNIGTIDFSEIFQKSSVRKNLTVEFKNQQESLKKTFSEKEKDLGKRHKELNSKKGILSEKAFADEEGILNQDGMKMYQEYKEKNSQLEADFMHKFRDEVNKITAGIAKGQKINIVLDESHIVYRGDNIRDITDLV